MTAEQIRDTVRTVVIVLIIMIGGCIWDQARAAEIEYNPEGSPIPAPAMQEAIRYALWSWTSRLPIDAEYTGLAGETETSGIVIQWADLPMLTDNGETLLLAKVWRWPGTDKGVIKLNRNVMFATTEECVDVVRAHAPGEIWDCFGDKFVYGGKVSECLIETISHELAHLLVSWEHSKVQGDVLYHNRDNCNPVPSLSDLQLSGLPIKSCHVELTPDGALESLSYTGRRYTLSPSGANQWRLGSAYANPLPKDCSGVNIESGVITAHVRSFGGGSEVWRLRNTNGNFVRF